MFEDFRLSSFGHDLVEREGYFNPRSVALALADHFFASVINETLKKEKKV